MNRESESAGQSWKCWENVRENQDWLKKLQPAHRMGNRYTIQTNTHKIQKELGNHTKG